MEWLVLSAVLLAAGWWVRRALSHEDLSVYDTEIEPVMVDNPASAAHAEQEQAFCRVAPEVAQLPKKQLLLAMRQKMDDWGVRHPTAARIVSVPEGTGDGAPVPGEWVLADGADPNKRLLYIHGGAFTLGSPQSHRVLTSKFSEISGAAVFALDYRLCPEHKRLDGLADCQNAYRWLLDNGPDGAAAADQLYVAGDSAGANFALVLLAWIRDQQLPAPVAAVALSPTVDTTLSSPSIAANIDTDLMLRPMLKPLLATPKPMLLRASWLINKVRPNDPRVSPILGSLAGLPPLLIQASTAECFEDDARRYTNKARAAGSPVRLQLWSNMMHVWQMFEPELDEARQAFEQIERFLADIEST